MFGFVDLGFIKKWRDGILWVKFSPPSLPWCVTFCNFIDPSLPCIIAWWLFSGFRGGGSPMMHCVDNSNGVTPSLCIAQFLLDLYIRPLYFYYLQTWTFSVIWVIPNYLCKWILIGMLMYPFKMSNWIIHSYLWNLNRCHI